MSRQPECFPSVGTYKIRMLSDVISRYTSPPRAYYALRNYFGCRHIEAMFRDGQCPKAVTFQGKSFDMVRMGEPHAAMHWFDY